MALSFLRDFFPTEKKGNSVGWAWLVLPSFLPSFLHSSFLHFFLPFFLSSFVRFRWRTRAGYTFRSAEVKREIRGGMWIESLWQISRSPPQLAPLRFTPAGWTSIARNTDPSYPSPPLPLIRAHRRRCRCDCFVSRSCPSTDRCPDTFDKFSCTSPRSCATDCTPSDCCTSSADPIDRKFQDK